MATTLYDVLGLPNTATQAEIKEGYRALARKYHPDKNPGDAEAERTFKEAAEAYAILSDESKRRTYDRGVEPISSVKDLFGRHSDGVRTTATMLPSAPLAPQPGMNMTVITETKSATLKKGGVVDVTVKTKDAERLFQVVVPADAERTPWCRIKGLGFPGRNGGDPGDLIVYFRITGAKAPKGKRA